MRRWKLDLTERELRDVLAALDLWRATAEQGTREWARIDRLYHRVREHGMGGKERAA